MKEVAEIPGGGLIIFIHTFQSSPNIVWIVEILLNNGLQFLAHFDKCTCQKEKLAQDAKKVSTLDVLWALDSSVAN